MLTSDSQLYSRSGCYGFNYYEALQIKIIETGKYIFSGRNLNNPYVYTNLYGYI